MSGNILFAAFFLFSHLFSAGLGIVLQLFSALLTTRVLKIAARISSPFAPAYRNLVIALAAMFVWLVKVAISIWFGLVCELRSVNSTESSAIS